MIKDQIPFNKPYMTGLEIEHIKEAHALGSLSGDGIFTQRCREWLEKLTGTQALLTHSCTAALEMSALLLNIEPGDEVIMPSYTFVSTANAFVLRGGVPVFVDIRPDTLNIDELKIADAITNKTKAIVPVHYAGVSCEMDTIMSLANSHSLAVVEDAAQCVMSSYRGKMLGSIGHFGTYSFHETKNIISGEGGALLVNKNEYLADAEILREKGTDRSRFLRGERDKYSWQNHGSSYLPGELIAAFLWGQMQRASSITAERMSAWEIYDELLGPLTQIEGLKTPSIPDHVEHNAHMYYVILPQGVSRDAALKLMREKGIGAIFHYVPLHSAPAGQRFGRQSGELAVTDAMSSRIVRLPLWCGIRREQQEYVVDSLKDAIGRAAS